VRITIKDIAKAAKVDISAVSRTLRYDPEAECLRKETRERIFRIARRMGYQPNPMARGLRTGRSFLIGMLIPNVTYTILPEVIQGVEDGLMGSHFGLLLGTYNSFAEFKTKVDFLFEKCVDGVIVVPEILPEFHEEYKRISKNIPLVCVAGSIDKIEFPRAYADGEKIGRIATEYLISLGHSRIGYVLAGCLSRLTGYRAALQSHGLAENASWVFMQDKMDLLFGQWRGISSAERPTGLIFEADMMAAEFLSIAQSRGFHIPEDISVVGTDDIFFGTISNPPLTTITLHKTEQGKEAAAMILKMIDGEVSTDAVLQPQLIVRRSCGAAGGRRDCMAMGNASSS